MERAELLESCEFIKHAQIVKCDLLFAGSNEVFVTGLIEDGREVRGIYKPRIGEAPLWDFPNGTLYKREYAAFKLSLALGWNLIPPTVIRNGPYGIGSMQLMINTIDTIRDLEEVAQGISVFKQVALFDYVVNNADRKAGHFLIDQQYRLWLVDHGLTFNAVPKLRTVLWDFAGEDISTDLLADVREFQKTLKKSTSFRKELLQLLQRKELEALEYRIKKVLRNPFFPHPSSEWSVPWPLY